jgi:potassium-transporting ATPase KdpC subunit
MSKMMYQALMTVIVFTILTGLIYPFAVTGMAQWIFPWKANGSIICVNGAPIGSILIGQQVDNGRYFWGRLSATTPYPYNGALSGGSNRGTNNPELIKAAQDRINALREADPDNTRPVPVDLVTASGSGLDPHITRAAADYQLMRVARMRSIDPAEVRACIEKAVENRRLGMLGEQVVNVLRLNMLLDGTGK